MATIIADNIVCPLGYDTETAYRAVKGGETGLRVHAPSRQIPFAYVASLFSDSQWAELAMDGYTRFEALAIRSITGAMERCTVPAGARTVLVISSTKGNVEELCGARGRRPAPGAAARRIAEAVGIPGTPIVVSNACISGVSALILASRLIEIGEYDYAVVCGADVQCPFVISGFQSLKALSDWPCRPFDLERLGLNLGEGAATVILSHEPAEGRWCITGGAVCNDAYHITNPAPKGTGCARAIEKAVAGDRDGIAQINAHGTATMFNDQMEAKAIESARLLNVPVNALKGYLGHTLGAAGIIETILTMHALDDGIVLATKGYDRCGVSAPVDISATHRHATATDFIKIISGFGGGNAALRCSRHQARSGARGRRPAPALSATHSVRINPASAEIDGTNIGVRSSGLQILTELYKRFIGDYPRFYKMDPLARLGLVAAELLIRAEVSPAAVSSARGVVLFNRSASVAADIEYLKTISDADNFFPSPSLFVYTLPNIVTGEIAIRHRFCSETAFYVLPDKDDEEMRRIIAATMSDPAIDSLVCGWVEYSGPECFEADIKLILKTEITHGPTN